MNLTHETIIRRQMDVIRKRLQEESLSPETIRHLNEKMREYQDALDEFRRDPLFK